MSLRSYKHVTVFVNSLVVLKYIQKEGNQNNNRVLQNSSGYMARLLGKDIQIQNREEVVTRKALGS